MITLSATSTRESRERRRDFVFWISYLAFAGIILTSYASLFRPLWIDEAIHFALSGQPTLGDLLIRLHNPDPGFLTRQTGFYQVLNYVTLQATGANWIALRLPSLLSGALLIWALYVFLRERGVPRGYQFLGLIAIAGQSDFMYYVGEARPYLPYAATSLGLLAFFSAGEEAQKQRSVRWLGWISLLFGALFHLYFLILLPFVLGFSLWYRFFSSFRRPTRPEIRRAAHLPLVFSAVTLALALGWLTWMRPQLISPLDPFAWTGGTARSFVDVFFHFHFQLIPSSAGRTAIVVGEVVLLGALLVQRRYRRNRDLFASTVLILMGLGTSALISISSVLNQYAIAPRQLAAGALLVTAGLIWQLWVVVRGLSAIQASPRQLILGSICGVGLSGILLIAYSTTIKVPLSLLILFSILAAGALTLRAQCASFKDGPTVIFGLVVTGGLLAASQMAPMGRGSAWWAIGSLMVMAVSMAVVSWRTWTRHRATSPGQLLAILVGLTAASILITASIERGAVIRNQFDSYRILVNDYNLAKPDLARYRAGLGSEVFQETRAPYGPGWVYMSNLNSLDGGSVWRSFGLL